MIASAGKRLLAFILDGIIPYILVVCVFISAGLPRIFLSDSDIKALGDFINNNPFMGIALGTIFAGLLLVIALLQVYFWTKSTSLGKAMLGMKVVNKQDGQGIGFFMMLLRELILKRVSELFCGLGYLWILIDKDNQAWHDKILDTIVVK